MRQEIEWLTICSDYAYTLISISRILPIRRKTLSNQYCRYGVKLYPINQSINIPWYAWSSILIMSQCIRGQYAWHDKEAPMHNRLNLLLFSIGAWVKDNAF